jgi:DNA-binding CsgD family transcriptional regulator
VKVIRRHEQPCEPSLTSPSPCHELYFFHERNTGGSPFHVEAGPGGQFPVEQAAGLLAMHCMVRGQLPQDYVVTVQVAQESLGGLAGKAEKLLQAGHCAGGPVKLTRREEQVLSGVVRSLVNKEIASSLNLSERTVKFHVSSLLSKFRVRSRMELAREVTRRSPGPMAAPQFFATGDRRTYAPAAPNHHNASHVGLIALAKRSNVI